MEHNQISCIGCEMAQKKRFGQTEALGAGSETRTRTTVKSQVFETSASTIPPFPLFSLNGCKFRKIFFDAQQITLFEKKISHFDK